MEIKNNEMFDKFLGMVVDVIAQQVKEKVKEFNFNTEDEKLMYKPKEVMKLLDVGHNTMYEVLLKDDTFPKVLIGRNIYVPKKELSEWISNQCKKN